MKTLVFVFALCAAAFALPRPASEEQDSDEARDAEFFVVPLERAVPPRGRLGDFGLDLAPPSPFERHPFFRGGLFGGRPDLEDIPAQDDFMTQMQEMLKEMRKQLTDLVQHAHHGIAAHGDDGEKEVGTRIGEGEGGDLPKNKTTSTTKVIDGHVVTVNETTYSSGDDGIGAVFRIKVVEVHPSEGPETEGDKDVEKDADKDADKDGDKDGDKDADKDSDKDAEKDADKDGDKESGEESKEKSPENASPEREPITGKTDVESSEDKHEETNEIPNHTQVHDEWAEEFDPSKNEIAVSQEWDDEGPKKEQYYDLRDDTKVNDHLSEQVQSQGLVMLEPDAEFVDPDRQYYRYEAMPQRIEAFEYAH